MIKTDVNLHHYCVTQNMQTLLMDKKTKELVVRIDSFFMSVGII